MAIFSWTTDKEEAKQEQQTLYNLLELRNALPNLPSFKRGIAVGSAYEENTKRAFATAIFFDQNGKCSHKIMRVNVEVNFPYVPGLLAFRVGPAICSVLDKIINQADLLVFDGQGIAHQRGFGLASHIGVLYNKPSIGVTRNVLYGKYINPPKQRFAYTDVFHPKNKTVIGYALSLGANCNACYISPGHNIDIETSLKVICNIAGETCFPFPIQKAHALSNKEAKAYWKNKQNML
ncbi:endonuclease V [Patescibacteria group bacterium]|nr:endonuclease V [Patescibacteria group bacterium]MBU4347281.1 endonuclease V [Patescibacteria group bacterium]MBU4455393.1 endonuclease V [Patescibacteria group bacterium]MCG2690645.1 endonuclease V [Candidatus Parcubacteria bacterium]